MDTGETGGQGQLSLGDLTDPEDLAIALRKEIGDEPFSFEARVIAEPSELEAFVRTVLVRETPLYLHAQLSTSAFSPGSMAGLTIVSDGDVVYLPFHHERGASLPLPATASLLQPLFESGLRKVFHDATFQLPHLSLNGLALRPPFSDVRLMGRELHRREIRRYDLVTLAKEHLHPRADHWTRALELTVRMKLGTGDPAGPAALDARDLVKALCADAVLVKRLHEFFGRTITEPPSVAYLRNEGAVIPVIADLSARGLRVDQPRLRAALGEFRDALKALDTELDRLSGGRGVNYNSAKQVLPILSRLGLEAVNPRNGKPSIAIDALERLPQDREFVRSLVRRRRIENQLMQIAPLREALAGDGRVRSHLTISAQQGERFSSVAPSLYIGKTDAAPGELTLRDFIVPDEDAIFGFFDFSSSHFRILAHLCEDERMIDLFRRGLDFHRATAAQLFAKPYEQVTAEDRARAKPMGLGVIYGLGEAGLARSLRISEAEARVMKNDFLFKVYPKLGPYLLRTNGFVKDRGFVRTGIYGVRVAVNPEYAFNGLNYQIQTTESEMMKSTLVKLGAFFRGRKSRVALPFHDEIIVCLHRDERGLIPEIRAIVEDHRLRVPMKSEVKISETSWAEARRLTSPE